MTPNEKTSLYSEINAGPLSAACAPYVAAGNHNAVATILNTDPAGFRQVTKKSITKGLLLLGLVPATDRLATGVGVSGAAISQTLSDKWRSRLDSLYAGDPVIDLDATMLGFLAQLIADDLATETEVDAITQHSISAAEFAIGRLATANDVWEALL